MTNNHANRTKCPSRFGQMSKTARQVGRVVAFLSREQIDFVDKIGKDALFSTGRKLSRTDIIQTMVETMRKLNISGAGICTTDELEKQMLDIVKKSLVGIACEIKNGQQQQGK